MRKKSLTILNLATLALALFTVAIAAVAALPGGRELIEGNFGVVRALTYAGWSLGVLALVWAGSLAAGFGTPTLAALRAGMRDPDLKRVRGALGVALLGNVVVLAFSPLGGALYALDLDYTWAMFVAHTLASLAIVALTSFVCLVRLRGFVDDVAPAPIAAPGRAHHVEPAGF